MFPRDAGEFISFVQCASDAPGTLIIGHVKTKVRSVRDPYANSLGFGDEIHSPDDAAPGSM